MPGGHNGILIIRPSRTIESARAHNNESSPFDVTAQIHKSEINDRNALLKIQKKRPPATAVNHRPATINFDFHFAAVVFISSRRKIYICVCVQIRVLLQ
jgi:hypothetical protein